MSISLKEAVASGQRKVEPVNRRLNQEEITRLVTNALNRAGFTEVSFSFGKRGGNSGDYWDAGAQFFIDVNAKRGGQPVQITGDSTQLQDVLVAELAFNGTKAESVAVSYLDNVVQATVTVLESRLC